MAHILLVGIATLDIVNVVERYPDEDAEVRALEQRIAPGGNAANTAHVLAALGHRAELSSVLADEPDGYRIEDALNAADVGLEHCLNLSGKAPTSYIVLNRTNGSRTIVHYRDLPEMPAAHFERLPIEDFDWIHFEGRNVEETARMMAHARARATDRPISLEIEKERPGIEALAGLADLVIFSRHFARGRGFDDATDFLRKARSWAAPGARLCCSWGDAGAWAQDERGQSYYSPAFRPDEVRDTLGAGDTFNAGLIDALVSGRPLGEAVEAACRLAGRKVGMEGFAGIAL